MGVLVLCRWGHAQEPVESAVVVQSTQPAAQHRAVQHNADTRTGVSTGTSMNLSARSPHWTLTPQSFSFRHSLTHGPC
jgi:hypothetical protein